MTESNHTQPSPDMPTTDSQVVYPKLALPESPQVPGVGPAVGPVPSAEGMLEQTLDPRQSPVAPPAPGRDRIMIGIPILRVTYEFLESFLKFWTSLMAAHDKRYEVCYHFMYRKPVHMAEETLVKTAQYNKCTHLLLMDDDIYDVTPDDLNKLYEADKDVIGGIMNASKFPHAMCAFRRYELDKKVVDMPVAKGMYRLYEIPAICDSCGAAQSHYDVAHCPHCGAEQSNLIQRADLIPFCFTLIKLDVFNKIKRPWFHCTNDYPTDSWFADRLLESGLSEHAHFGVRLNHAGITDENKPFYVQMGMQKARSMNTVVNLTPEQMEQHQDLLQRKMYETEQLLRDRPEIIYDAYKVANADKPSSATLVTHGK